MATVEDARVDVGETTVVWGNASRWKATLRDEAQRHYLALPLSERVRRALSMVLPRGVDRE
jgi:hypothetical protein